MAEDAKTLPEWGSTDAPTYDGLGHQDINKQLVTQEKATFVWTDYSGAAEGIRDEPALPRSEP